MNRLNCQIQASDLQRNMNYSFIILPSSPGTSSKPSLILGLFPDSPDRVIPIECIRDLGLLRRDRKLQERYDDWARGIAVEHGSMGLSTILLETDPHYSIQQSNIY